MTGYQPVYRSRTYDDVISTGAVILQELEALLEKDVIDLKALRKSCFMSGCPHEKSIRSRCWKIFLNYLPLERKKWKTELQKQRNLYKQYLQEMIVLPGKKMKSKELSSGELCDHPLNPNPDSEWSETFRDNEMLVQIDKDCRKQKLTSFEISQGMNEILGPIYYTLASDSDQDCREFAEADSFFLFTCLMGETRDFFIKTLDDSACGIVSQMAKLTKLLEKMDKPLWQRIADQGIKPQFYAFRWITLLLSQEFHLPDVLRIWDSLFSDANRFDFLIFLCCAMLMSVRTQVLNNDFPNNMKLLQRIESSIDLQRVLSKARELSQLASIR
ncbi:TBC1 domain family member 13 [Elysia marginata]|uniref:TBC1 domain family member 13 n=1 Tax=Elysia marginata TaxID=1093978 RepID=A0AAV4G495_9GAST|nr:TBC1 domain family member 13 [Elysia marginata]